jgi:hypothetical protein
LFREDLYPRGDLIRPFMDATWLFLFMRGQGG